MKLVIDTLEAVVEPLRTEYEARDGKFYLKMEGDNPVLVALNAKVADASAKIAATETKISEFRDNNIRLSKELDVLKPQLEKFKDIDPDAARDALFKVAALGKKGIKDPDDIEIKLKTALTEALKPYDATLAQLRDQNAAFAAKSLADAQRADDYLLQSQISEKFLKAGGKAKATDFIVGKAKEVFEVKDGIVAAKTGKFNPDKPGELLTPEDWLVSTLKEYDFAVEPSKGGGAPPMKGSGNGPVLRAGQTVLKNPTPQELGQASADILSGKVKVEFDQAVTH